MKFVGESSANPPEYPPADITQSPLSNLETLRLRMDSLHQFLLHSINTNTVINKDQTVMVSSEITSAINQIIVNGAAIVAASSSTVFPANKSQLSDHTGLGSDFEIVELDAVELLAEHVHFCEICGKGFKRDANLRMHMRAHGNRFKTHEALTKPDKELKNSSAERRFSCPFHGCNRNQHHAKFRPLKSVICVKNHFKRSHCPKMFSCNRCNKKSFSVIADLKSHLKHCGGGAGGGEVSKWKCTCGTTFSRKDKLFGHVGLFEGHMPAVVVERSESDKGGEFRGSGLEAVGFEGFTSVEGYRLEDVVGLSGYYNGRGSVSR